MEIVTKSKLKCPECGVHGQNVKVRTIKNWIGASIVPFVPEVTFYFCKTNKCPIIYFTNDSSVKYLKEQLSVIR